ncbi:MAG: universal stress protein [Acidimicrobiales bacterium]
MTYVLVAIVAWIAVGLAIAVIGRRAGHNLAVFSTFGVMLGPLSLLFLARAVAQPTVPPSVRRIGAPGAGWIDVLVGVDGSPESTASATACLATLGESIRRSSIAVVLDAETAERPGALYSAEQAASRATAFAAFEPWDPDLVDLGGRPDWALLDHARAESFDLIVIGHPRSDLARVLLGSTASRLIESSEIPVLVGGVADLVTASRDSVDEGSEARVR